ncbi:MAG: hypothetical protein NT062_34520 [Proteobacteria bacterium]|nr:hypothetical protein [Pseudomonadota bacterium]
MKLSLGLVLVLGACTVNGKPMFGGGGGGNTTPGPTPTGDTPQPEIPKSVPAPATYAWCKDVQKPASGINPSDDDPIMVAKTLCYPDAYAMGKRNETEAKRLRAMQAFGMTEADWARDAPEWVNTPSDKLYGYKLKITDPNVNTAKGFDQFALILAANDKLYVADSFAMLGMTGRLALVESSCSLVPTGSTDEAICSAEVASLDLAKLGAEIRNEAGRSSVDRMTIRGHLANLRSLFEHYAKPSTVDPKVIDLVAKARADWAANLAARKPYLEQLNKIADGDKSDCSALVKPAFERAFANFPPTSLAGVHRRYHSSNAAAFIAQDADGWIAGRIAHECSKGAVAKLFAMLDDKTFHGSFQSTRTRVKQMQSPSEASGMTYGHYHAGVIGSVKDAGKNMLKVTFAKQPSYVSAECSKWVRGNKVTYVSPGGAVQYEEVCAERINVTIDSTPNPFEISKDYAAGLEKGHYIEVIESVEGPYLPPSVWLNEKTQAPLALFGVMLKQ